MKYLLVQYVSAENTVRLEIKSVLFPDITFIDFKTNIKKLIIIAE